MKLWTFILSAACATGLAPAAVALQTVPKPEPASQGAPSAGTAAEGQNPPRSSQLDEFKRSILDPAAEYGTRRTVANLLVRTGTPEACRAAAEILESATQPAAQKAVCDALGQAGVEAPELFGHAEAELLVDRLAVLIGAEEPELRVKASIALGAMPRRFVVGKVLAIASSPAVPEPRRLAAMDALARHIHNRPVVALFIALLDDPSPSIAQRALLALAPASRSPVGSRPEEWKEWWSRKARLSDQEWLEDRVELLSTRERALEAQHVELQSALERQASALNTKIADLESDLLLALPDKDRDARLTAWLGDPTPAICGGALQLVLRRISDASGAPSEPVRAAVVKNLEHPSPEVRRRALQVLGAIKDAADAMLVHDRLARETDPLARQTALSVLGQLNNVASVPILIAQVADVQAPPDCVAAAVRAIAQIALGDTGLKPADWDPAVAPLRERLVGVGDQDNGLRASIVEAMAATANPSFEPDILAQFDRSEPAVLRAAVRGAVRLRMTATLPKIRTLTSAADATVRQAACEAIGELGSEDADLEALVLRLKLSVENQPPVREAAWAAYRTLLATRPVDQQWAWLDRLSDEPALQIEHLSAMSAANHASRLEASQMLIVRQRLAAVLVAQGRWSDAREPLQQVFEHLVAQRDAAATEAGLKWLDAVLRADDPTPLVQCVPRLAALGPEVVTQTVGRVEAYLNSEEGRARPERRVALLRQLEAVPKEGLGEGWERLLHALRESTGATPGSLSDSGPRP